MEIGIMFGDLLWRPTDQKHVSVIYRSIDTDGRRIVNSRNFHLILNTLRAAVLFLLTDETFNWPRIITFDSYVLLTTKQACREVTEEIFKKLKELSENCDPHIQEDILIRDLFFFAIMRDTEIQKELAMVWVWDP